MKSIIYTLICILVSCQTVPVVTMDTAVGRTYKNIKIIESPAYETGSCEPSIAINPMNPNNMVAGNVLNDYHYTFDGGKTWTSNKLQSDLGVFGDPCLVADSKGTFYYLHLANPDTTKTYEMFIATGQIRTFRPPSFTR